MRLSKKKAIAFTLAQANRKSNVAASTHLEVF
jgi:hypothetical protein